MQDKLGVLLDASHELFVKRNPVTQEKRALYRTLSNSSAGAALVKEMGPYQREAFIAIFLNAKNKVVSAGALFQGGPDSSAVFPSEVARRALLLNATGVIVAHNHPSGDTEPSAPDKRITKDLCEVLRLLQIRFLDHIITGEGSYYSFADNGILDYALI